MSFVQPPSGPVPWDQLDPVKGIRVSQIICVALMMGLLMFFGITLITSGEPHPPMIAYIGVMFAATSIGLRFVIPGISARSQIKNIAASERDHLDARLFAVFQTKMIIGLALLEGAGFFNLIAYMTERQWWSIAVVGTLLFLMAMMFPTLNQFENWAEDVKRDMQSQF